MKHKNIMIIAIDGPAASGKTTLAKALSEKLGIEHIDTGAMYRSFALFAIKKGVPLDDEKSVEPLLKNFRLEFKRDKRGLRIYMNGCDVTEEIRKKEIGEGASRVSVHRAVRMKMVEIQSSIGRKNGGIFDGRDIGTFVFPEADLKIYLTASIEERAKRKLKEWKERGIEGSIEEAKRDVIERDKRDSERPLAPLLKAEEAIEIDTTNLSPHEVLERILKILKERQTLNLIKRGGYLLKFPNFYG